MGADRRVRGELGKKDSSQTRKIFLCATTVNNGKKKGEKHTLLETKRLEGGLLSEADLVASNAHFGVLREMSRFCISRRFPVLKQFLLEFEYSRMSRVSVFEWSISYRPPREL